MWAFQESRAILTALELDLFEAVGEGGNAAGIAAKLNAEPRSTEMLLNAMTALDLLQKSGETFHNSELSTRHLTGSARIQFMFSTHLWDTWSGLTKAVRAGTAVDEPGVEGRNPEWTKSFIAAMHRSATDRAVNGVRAIGIEGVRRILDVGGGSGAYSIAFAQADPNITSELFDIAPVTELAHKYIADADLSSRIRTRVGDMTKDQLGDKDFDLVLLSAICHMFGESQNRDLLRRCFDACAPGGRIVIQDFILDDSKTKPKAGALFALNMLVNTREGNNYSETEYSTWLSEAGFRDVRHVPLPGPTGLMIGRRPAEGDVSTSQ